MKRPQYVFRPNLSDPQHRRAWALLQQVPSAKRKEFLVQAILATEQTDRLEKSIRKVVREELQANLPQIKAERMPQDFSVVLPKLWRKRQAWDTESTKRPPYRGEER